MGARAMRSVTSKVCGPPAPSPSETPLRVASIPQNPLTFFRSSPGFATMLPKSTGSTEPGLLMPTAVVDTLGLTLGDPIQTADGPTVLGGTYEYPDDGRTTGMGYAAIAPSAPDTKFDECWIDAYPVSQATTDLLYTTIAADSNLPDTGPQLSQHNMQLGKPVAPGLRSPGGPPPRSHSRASVSAHWSASGPSGCGGSRSRRHCTSGCAAPIRR